MSWNYRVVRREFPEWDVTQYGVHEIYYDDEREATSCTEDAIVGGASCVEELRTILNSMLQSLDKEVLEYSSF